MKKPIYLDYAATTPIDKKVVKKMLKYLTKDNNFGNPASRSHIFGWKAEEAVDISRENISDLIHADPREIIFTSGATESINLAIKGIMNFYKNKGNHIITSRTEHKAVLDTCRYLESKNCKVTYIKPNKKGLIKVKDIKKNIRKKTVLISIMHVNNETGIIQNIKKISKICKNKKIFFHVDATQSIGKIKINIKKIKIDLMSFSAHKIYGPKGIGALFIRRNPRIRISPQIHGGGHERGMRSGTLPVHQIVGMGEAFKIAKKNMKKEYKRLIKLRNLLWNNIKNIEEIYLNSKLKYSSPHILNVSFNYIEGESIIMALKDLAISSGSACTSASLEPSYVLKSMGIKTELAHSSIRFSIGRFTTKDEINYASKIIHKSVKKLRKLSPLWEMFKEGINIEKIDWSKNT
ncbi:IscS subfamily cysteine desulfurase [Buchnera aphidicola (Ceratoglyphina bambusae)]|uniref:IscS subfamily cysteine desulfurase n=1 Tax=Buchnera aphidicola TaxID=9 RepID=UPI0031B82B64